MRILRRLLAAVVTLSVISCGNPSQKTPDSGFADYIEAYTGGVVSSGSDIVIELAEPAQGLEGTESELAGKAAGLFRFSPALGGTAGLDGQKRIIFTPAEGALKPGTRYDCTFSLDKVAKTDSGHRQFRFSFVTARKTSSLEAGDVVVSAGERGAAVVTGTLTLSETLDTDTPENLLEFSYPEKGAEFNVAASGDGKHFTFTAAGLKRGREGSRDNVLKVKFKPGKTGFDACDDLEINVPSSGKFRITGAELAAGEDNALNIAFSEPLDPAQNLAGLVVLCAEDVEMPGTGYSVSDNHLKVYMDGSVSSGFNVEVSEAVRDIDGNRLEEKWRKSFDAPTPLPEVSFPVEGNILPDPKNLVIPFNAVNLRAVDVKVIKIYRDNILAFLQDNDLGGSSQLRRAGRLIYKTTLRLDTDASRDLTRPDTYTVDLSGLFSEEPGAIYRVKLSFKRDYYIYSSSGENAGSSDGLVNTTSGQMTESDEAVWDIPNAYYFDAEYDWNNYNWRDRKNPLTPSYYMDYEYPYRNLMCSKLGVIAKYSESSTEKSSGRLWVAVNDIISAEPVHGAEIKVYNYQLRLVGKGKSGQKGLAEIELGGKPFAVVVHKGNSDTYLRIVDGGENSLSRFDTGGETLQRGLKAYIYGERGVWRPADTLHLTMILHGDAAVPEDHPVSMDVYTPQGQFYTRKICRKSENGFYSFDFATGQDSPTGLWNAWFKVGGATFHKALRIETVKPNRLKVNADFSTNVLEAGTKPVVSIASNWLTGPAASGLAARVSMTLKSGKPDFKGFENYTFTDPASRFESFTTELLSTTLDASGKASSALTLPKAEQAPGMLSADILCSVTEDGGDESYATMTLPFSPFNAYVGVKLPAGNDGYVETGKEYRMPVAVLDVNGKRVSGHHIEWRIFRLKWSWWWESKAEPLDSYINASGATAFSSGTALSGTGDISVPFHAGDEEWGRYLVYVKDLDSGHASGGIIYADLPAYQGRSNRNDPDAPAMLGFSLDKTSYTAGETATVFIPAAKDGRALVSIENGGSVLSSEWVKTSADSDTPYKIRITEEMAPNFYVHITLLQPYWNSSNDLPLRMYGVQPVLVENPGSHLEPVISMPDKLHPQEPFTVKVSEKKGRKMTYTLAIVDEGLLDLTAFKTPDPWSAMYRREALGVRTWDVYDNVFGTEGGAFAAMFSIGGDAGIIRGARKENRFNPVVSVLGPFTLKSGSASHRITLPMYVGSVRVMLVAGDGNAFGNAEKTVPVTSPVMILPTLPRIAGCGEKMTLPVNVFVMEEGISSVNVSVKCEGPLKISGSSSAAVQFDGTGDRMATFTLVSDASSEGMARVTVNADGGGHRMSEAINIEVRNPATAVISQKSVMLGKGESCTFRYGAFTASDGEGCRLEAGGTPSINWNALFRYMSDYSNTCTEQLSAKGLSLLNAMPMLSETNAGKAGEMIPQIARELYSRQLADGGFAYWPGNANADEWVTSMAGEFLVSAKSAGYEIGGGVIPSWIRFQKRCVQNYRTSKVYPMSDLNQAYRLYTLALSREQDEAAMNRLKESADLSWQASMMLASTYAVCGKKAVGAEILGKLPASPEKWTTEMRTYGTPLRDKTIALEAMARTGNISGAVTYAQGISGCGFGSTGSASASSMSESGLQPWSMTTQESAFAARALALLSKNAASGPLKIRVNDGTDRGLESTDGKVICAEVDPSAGKVSVTNESEGPVYVRFSSISKPAAGVPVAPAASGISLGVKYSGPDGSALDPSSVRQGTEFSAVLKVANRSQTEDYADMALTQIIPSGWEIVNERLSGQDVPSEGLYDYLDIRDDRNVFYFSLPRGSYKEFRVRLRAAYRGTYALPSVSCEAMYNTSVYARTASGTAEVTE